MHASGEQAHLDQRRVGEFFAWREVAGRFLALLVHFHAALAGLWPGGFQRGVHVARSAMPRTGHQRQITLVQPAFAQQVVQMHQGGPGFGNQQAAGGITVQTMGKLQKRGMRPQFAQRLDQPDTYPAAAMHRQTGRLIDYQKLLVLVQNPFQQPIEPAAGGRLGGEILAVGFGAPYRRQAHHIARFQAVIRLGTALIDPHLALAQQAVHTGTGDAFEGGEQEVVQALAGMPGVHGHVLHPRAGTFGRGV